MLAISVNEFDLLEVSSLELAKPLYCEFVALSPEFAPLVLFTTVNCASVTYLLFALSAISAVVASVPVVTRPFAS